MYFYITVPYKERKKINAVSVLVQGFYLLVLKLLTGPGDGDCSPEISNISTLGRATVIPRVDPVSEPSTVVWKQHRSIHRVTT